jgi:hypothetical protein
MRYLTLLVSVAILALFAPNAHVGPPAPAGDIIAAGQDVAHAAPAAVAPAPVEHVVVDAQPYTFASDDACVSTVDGSCASGVLLREFYPAAANSSSLTTPTTTSRHRHTADVWRYLGDRSTRRQC